MKKKILFIQPFYFFYGHYYGLFNNLVDNLYKIKDLPKRNSLRYKKFINGLVKFDQSETGQAKVNFFYNKISNS